MVEEAMLSGLVINTAALAALGVAVAGVFTALAVIQALSSLKDKAYQVITENGKIYYFRFLMDALFINYTYINAFTPTIAVITSFFDDHLTANPDEEDVVPDTGLGETTKPDEGSGEGSGESETDTLPNQGTVEGDVVGAPKVDAGKQGKHVPGHNNNDPSKSQWPEGKTGVHETQQGWLEGTQLPEGTKVWDSGKVIGQNGETGVRVRQRIDYLSYFLHGYCVSAEGELIYRYCVGIARWIHNWIIKNKNSNAEFSFLWFEMIYSITSTEEEAWELFFRLSYEYLDHLEA